MSMSLRRGGKNIQIATDFIPVKYLSLKGSYGTLNIMHKRRDVFPGNLIIILQPRRAEYHRDLRRNSSSSETSLKTPSSGLNIISLFLFREFDRKTFCPNLLSRWNSSWGSKSITRRGDSVDGSSEVSDVEGKPEIKRKQRSAEGKVGVE